MPGIVVGYDGTEPSKAALETAVGLARDTGESVFVVFGYGVNPMGGEVQDHAAALKERGERVTADAVAVARNASVEAEIVLTDLEGPEALISAGDDCGARMIVVGSRGEGPIRGALLGVTAYRLVHISDRPVLVVPARR